MTIARFPWQVQCAQNVEGIVLNVGANDDPAGMKGIIGERVQNVDFYEVDPVLGHRNSVDLLFDITEPWPLEDDYAALVVAGDIMEHIHEPDWPFVLSEMKRVAPKLAITVPNDPRFLTNPEEGKAAGSFHVTHVTEEFLRDQLGKAGWLIVEWHTVDYTFVPTGYFVLCERSS